MRAISTINVETACVYTGIKALGRDTVQKVNHRAWQQVQLQGFLLRTDYFVGLWYGEREGGGGGGWGVVNENGHKRFARSKQTIWGCSDQNVKNNEPRRDFLVLLKKKRLCGMIYGLTDLTKKWQHSDSYCSVYQDIFTNNIGGL